MSLFNSQFKKTIAVFLLFIFMFNVFTPTISYALTAGPTAPEATSFEPVDTTDMVNLLTGDMTYNMPLLEVPGPEGGYPLSLSYHAGIQPNEEASWVGLGWTLNPGAITRNVNGYADDHNAVQNVVRDIWDGGVTHAYTVGVTVGIANTPLTVGGGLSFSQDTYQGFGVGAYVSGGNRIMGQKSPIGVGFTVGTSTDVGGYASAYAGITTGGDVAAGMGLSASTNFNTISYGAGVSLSKSNGPNAFSSSILGASISSGGSKPSLSVGGGSASVNNASVGKISTVSGSFAMEIPVAPLVNISFGGSYLRYWSDESASVSTYGVLHNPATAPSLSTLDNSAYDVSRLLDKDENVYIHYDPSWLTGGSIPSYDNYSVTAQGLSGNMRPYALKSMLYMQTRMRDGLAGEREIKTDPLLGYTGTNTEFRFMNDFSNRSVIASGNINASNSPATVNFNLHNTGNEYGIDGYNASKNQLEGTRHIEYFTNAEIKNNAANAITGKTPRQDGLINTNAPGFVRDDNSQIGAFMITNASGVTYHYALPVYAKNEYTRMENTRHDARNELTKKEKYAYTWYLTAITGPDFIDKNNNGRADENDWGYWVRFDYGLWANNYKWRNPSEGAHRDLDNKFTVYSTGEKELYYLNRIATRTHTALFEKEIRADGKGAAYGGYYDPQYRQDVVLSGSTYLYSYRIYRPVSSLKLNKIYLVKNEDLNDIEDVLTPLEKQSADYDHKSLYLDHNQVKQDVIHSGLNVIDKFDLNAIRQDLESKSLRVIDFNHDYSSCVGLPNSYDTSSILYQHLSEFMAPLSQSIYETKNGKLTLNSIAFRGIGGQSVLPPTIFSYDNADSGIPATMVNNSMNATTKRGSLLFTHAPAQPLEPGQMREIIVLDKRYTCAVIKQLEEVSASLYKYEVAWIGQLPPNGAYIVNSKATKNPNYNKDFYDMWMMLKVDYMDNGDNDQDRRTSSVSAKAVDAWCLREIRTGMGSKMKIVYESDQYRNVVLYKNGNFPVSGFEKDVTGHPDCIKLILSNGETDLRDIYTVDTELKYMLGVLKQTKRACPSYINSYATFVKEPLLHDNYGAGTSVIKEVGEDYLVVENTAVKAYFDSEINSVTVVNGELCGVKVTNQVVGGNVFMDEQITRYGGGLRVKSVSMEDGFSSFIKTTEYDYTNNSNKSSGITSFEPIGMGVVDMERIPLANDPYNFTLEVALKALENDYNAYLLKSFSDLLIIASEVPAPGVMYGSVTVSEKVKNGAEETSFPGYSTYSFQVFDERMVNMQKVDEATYNKSTYVNHYYKNWLMSDLTSSVGNLKKIQNFDKEGRIISETVNRYLYDEILESNPSGTPAQFVSSYNGNMASRYNSQGVIEEAFADSRQNLSQIVGSTWYYDLKSVYTRKQELPSVLVSSSTTDYKTSNSSVTYYDEYDFYNGQAIKTRSRDSYGNEFMTEVLPAYRVYGPMGMKINNPDNKHMIAQTALSASYKLDENHQPAYVLSASAQTWSNEVPVLGVAALDQQSVWRKKSEYYWAPKGTTGNGMTSIDKYVPFDQGSPGEEWQRSNEITLYNKYSHALEAIDINGNYASGRMGYKQSRVLATAAMAGYDEFAYSGAEDLSSLSVGGVSNGQPGSVEIPDLSVVYASGTPGEYDPLSTAHTGVASLKTYANTSAFKYTVPINKLTAGRSYTASVWVRNSSTGTAPVASVYYEVDGGTKTYAHVTGKKAGNWYRIDLKIPASALSAGTTLKVVCQNTGSSGYVYFDDFRFAPVNAGMNAYVYDHFSGQVTDILDANNMFSHYQYDAAGRLKKVHAESLDFAVRPVAEHKYKYGVQGGYTLYDAAFTPLALGAKQVRITVSGLLNSNAPYQVKIYPSAMGNVVSSSIGLASGSVNATLTQEVTMANYSEFRVDAKNGGDPEPKFTITYTATGTYFVKIIVEDDLGNSRELVKQVTVN